MITLHVPHFKSIIYLEKCSQKSDVLSGRKSMDVMRGPETLDHRAAGTDLQIFLVSAELVVSKTAVFTHQSKFGCLVRSKPSPRLSVEKSLCLLNDFKESGRSSRSWPGVTLWVREIVILHTLAAVWRHSWTFLWDPSECVIVSRSGCTFVNLTFLFI